MYNAGGTIERTLASLCEQTLGAWEAIVVDDGSTDDGPERVALAAESDPRIVMVRVPNGGLASARNVGLERVRGEFVSFVDADDWLLPGGLERLLNGAQETGAAYGGSAWHDEGGSSLGWSYEPTCPVAGFDQLLEFNRFTPASQLLRTDLIGNERFDRSVPGVEDHDMWLRLAARGVRWTSVGADTCAYRLRASGMSRGFGMMARSHAAVIDRAFARPVRGVDRREARRVRIRRTLALGYATANAWIEREGSMMSLRMLETAGALGRITASEAAHAAAWMIPYADCRAQNAWECDELAGRYCLVLHRWWSELSRLGWSSPELPAAALRELARSVAPERAVAERLAERAMRARNVVVHGLGRRGRALLSNLAQRGKQARVHDHALMPGQRSVMIDGIEYEALGGESAFSIDALHVLTPADDSLLLSRLPLLADAVRWRDCQAEAAADSERRLLALWPTSGPRLVEAAA